MRDSDKAYEMIKEKILFGELRCGQTIDDEELESDIGVGKTPIREAIFRLVQDGYVVNVPHRGTSVASYDLSELSSMLNIRTALAPLLANQIVQNARDRDIVRCEAEMKNLFGLGERTIEETIRIDNRFHEMLGELSNDRILFGILSKLEFMTDIAVSDFARGYFKEKNIETEFSNIFLLIKQRDTAGLTEALCNHIPQYGLRCH